MRCMSGGTSVDREGAGRAGSQASRPRAGIRGGAVPRGLWRYQQPNDRQPWNGGCGSRARLQAISDAGSVGGSPEDLFRHGRESPVSSGMLYMVVWSKPRSISSALHRRQAVPRKPGSAGAGPQGALGAAGVGPELGGIRRGSARGGPHTHGAAMIRGALRGPLVVSRYRIGNRVACAVPHQLLAITRYIGPA